MPDVLGRSAVVDVNNEGSTLAIGWTATPCATGSTISLRPLATALGIEVGVAEPGGCGPLGATYTVLLDLRLPLGDRTIVIAQDDPDARSWGAALLASDGRRRPLLVVDRSGMVDSVVPMDPTRVNPDDGGVVVRPGDGERAVVVSWAGDVCDDRTEVTVDLAADVLSLRVVLASESAVPCAGQMRFEGIGMTFMDPVNAAALRTSLVSRH